MTHTTAVWEIVADSPSRTACATVPRMATMKAAMAAARAADVMLVAGSSLEVAPAGELPALARANGARLILINRGPTHMDDVADVIIRGDVAEVLPRLAEPWTRESDPPPAGRG